jgi:YHS domain-containing protein
MLSAATSLALFQTERILAAERVALPQEPARLTLSESARALSPVKAVRGLLGHSKESSAVPVQTIGGSGKLPLVKVAEGEDMSPVERELKKLYDRDGRKMPPMRKPAVPDVPPGSMPKQRPGSNGPIDIDTPAGLPAQTQTAQPMPTSKPGVLNKLNPFNKKPATQTAANGQPSNVPQPPGASTAAPNATPAKANGGQAADEFEDELADFEQPTRNQPGSGPQVRSTQPRIAEFPAVNRTAAQPQQIAQPQYAAPQYEPPRPAAPRVNPQDDFENPFADESPRPPESRPAPARPAPTIAPRTAAAPVQPSREENENPFTGLKLDEPPRPQPRTTAPAVSPRATAPRLEAPRSEGNPFESQPPAPPQLNAPAQPRFAAEPQPRLAAPPSNEFEPPVLRTQPEPMNTPSLQAPELPRLPSTERDDSAPRPPAEGAGPRFGTSEPAAPSETRSAPDRDPAPAMRSPAPRLAAPRSTSAPHAPSDNLQPGARTLPPKPLDPEPAAELPKNPHERKLRMIAQRSGTGFKGFCPVTLRDERELVDAAPQFMGTYEGQTYAFASLEAQRRFERDPKKYTPMSSGYDVVLLGNHGREVPGSLDYAIWYKDRLHLFSSRETLETFVENLNTGTGK